MDEHALALVRNRRIGFVFQAFNLIPRTDALTNVEIPMAYAKVPRRERRERADGGAGDRRHGRPRCTTTPTSSRAASSSASPSRAPW